MQKRSCPGNGISITDLNILAIIFPLLYLNQILISLFTHGFTFALVLLYRDSDLPLPHFIPSHISDCGFPGRQVLGCTSIVLSPPKSTQTSAIYKFTTGLSHHTLFPITQFALRSFESYSLTVGSSRLLCNYCHPIFEAPPVRFPYFAICPNLFRGSSGWWVHEISNS
jgi:hypothetical protein